MEMEELLFNLPKLELHAHLNGSLSTSSIKELEQSLEQANDAAVSNKTSDVNSILLSKEFSMDEQFKKFAYMHQLTATPLGLRLATQLVIRNFARENVIYLELRSTPKSTAHMTRKAYLLCILEAIQNATEVKNGDIIVKLLPSIDRSKPVHEAAETLDIVLELRATHCKLIAGMDFSGNPTKGIFADFIPVLAKAKAQGLPLAIHCAEIEHNEETTQMINFGMQRCGHGTFLSAQHRDTLAKQHIAVECCLSSNVKCSTVASYDDHHFKHIFAQQAAVVLCTDDCGAFDTTLTEELLLATKTFNLSIKDIKQLTLNALEYAFIADENERCVLREKLQVYFNAINC